MTESNLTTEPTGLLAVGRFFWELIKIFLIAVVIIVPVRYFVVQPFVVRGASMEPNFDNGEYLIIDELSYRWREPRRGEVIVFRYPNDPHEYFIKRIIGVPHDSVTIANGRIEITNQELPQGAVLDESPYLVGGEKTGGQLTVTLAPDEFFVLGDNRDASSDSRSWGPLARHFIIGRAWVRAFPFSDLAVFSPLRARFLSL